MKKLHKSPTQIIPKIVKSVVPTTAILVLPLIVLLLSSCSGQSLAISG